MTEPIENTPRTVRQRAVALVIALVIGGVWMNYGAGGVASLILLGGVFWVSRWLGPGRGRPHRQQIVDFPDARFGPSESEIDLDPTFRMFSHNFHHQDSD